MNTARIKWREAFPGASDEDMEGLQHIWGVRLPLRLRTVLRYSEMAIPVPNEVSVPNVYSAALESMLNFTLNLPGTAKAQDIMIAIQDRCPSGIIPFGDEGSGDLFCLDYRHSATEPRIVYWYATGAALHYDAAASKEEADREADGKALIHLADSFDEFLALLH